MVLKKQSAGLILYRIKGDNVEVLLAHMGGPYHASKDNGHWSIPKGLCEENENPFTTARREFEEEIGQPPPDGNYLELGKIEQRNNKEVAAWALESDLDVSLLKSNTFNMEWPPSSGKMQEFPEIDKADWFNLKLASQKLIPSQVELLKRLADRLKVSF